MRGIYYKGKSSRRRRQNEVTSPKQEQKALSKEQDREKKDWKMDEMRKNSKKIKITIVRF